MNCPFLFTVALQYLAYVKFGVCNTELRVSTAGRLQSSACAAGVSCLAGWICADSHAVRLQQGSQVYLNALFRAFLF
jgi:hypothetical protein